MSKVALKQRYVEIAPAVPLTTGGPQTFTYQLPSSAKLSPFSLVTISFGRQLVPGVVMEDDVRKPHYQTKSIKEVLPGSLTPRQVAFAKWIARHMHGGLGYTLRLFSPPPTLSGLSKIKTKLGSRSKKIAQPAAIVEPDVTSRWQKLRPLIESVLKTNKQVLILVPEVWLVKELTDLLESQLPDALLLPYYGSKRTSEQKETWQALSAGQSAIVIGTQKALFLPWQNLGLVIVEEEYWSSHKLWDQYPRLHNQRAASVLADIHGARLVSSSSFPSLQLWHEVTTKAKRKIKYAPRSLAVHMISPSLDDRRQRLLLPEELKDRLKIWNRKKEKVLIFFNRRGAWQAIFCSACRQRVVCPKCETSLAVHGPKETRQLICHRCGYEQDVPKTCPNCHKKSLRFVGVGTEVLTAIVDQLASISTKVIRIDADTIKQKSAAAVQNSIKSANVIVATSAILTHVGYKKFDRIVWLFPERGLQYPDFRSSERTFLLMARLASHLPSPHKMVLVSREPELLKDLTGSDLDTVFAKLLKERKRLNYPPLVDMVRLSILSTQAERAKKRAEQLRQQIDRRIAEQDNVLVRGPYQGFIPKAKGKYQYHLLLLGSLKRIADLQDGLSVDLVDVDPQTVL